MKVQWSGLFFRFIKYFLSVAHVVVTEVNSYWTIKPMVETKT